MFPKIQDGAIFIADAHEDEKREDFYNFLRRVESGDIATKQLFLMGDMFDLLVGKVTYTIKRWRKHIDLINLIALHVEVFYLEGNHDFALLKLFKNVKVIPIQAQPMQFVLEDDTAVYLSHGDKYNGSIYYTYTSLIRLSFLLVVLNSIDMMCGNFISKKVIQAQLKKNLCFKMADFEAIINSKISNYHAKPNSYIIEGHYHQNYRFEKIGINYINLPSFACNKSYIIVECQQDDKFALRGCSV